MPSEIKIEPATETDLPAVKALLLELLDAVTSTQGLDVEQSIENCRTLLKDPTHYMLMARDKDSILGFINFTTRRTIMHTSPSGLIDELVVTGSSRGAGIGKQLIQAAIQKCRELGCCEVEVSTEMTNEKARAFYKSCGFEEDSVLLEYDLD